VRLGQTLAVLRGESLIGAQRELAQAAVQAQLARESVRRDEALFQEGIVAESRVQATRAALTQARAHLAERRASLRLMGFSAAEIAAAEQGEKLSDSVNLVAPIAGTVLEVQAATGGRIEAATPLLRIASLDTLWLEIHAPVDIAALLTPGQKVVVPGTRAEGTVLVVGSSVSAAQAVLIRAQVGNPGGELRLNQQVTVRIEGKAGGQKWRVPGRAIVRQDGKDWVFVEAAGGFVPMAVQVLSRSGQSAAVEAPFTGRERVVVEGVAAVKAAWQGMGGE
jgi:cobalt-zinc-cadmium efflux system membrane fusion protein